MENFKRKLKNIFHAFVYIFAIIGFAFVAMFFAIRLHLTDTKGTVDKNDNFFQNNAFTSKKVLGSSQEKNELSVENISQEIERLKKIKELKNENYCLISAIYSFSPTNAHKIVEANETTNSDEIVAKMITAVKLQLNENSEFMSKTISCENTAKDYQSEYNEIKNKPNLGDMDSNLFQWINHDEWKTIRSATAKDKDMITEVGKKTGVEPRIIVACLIGEQLRLFNSQRQIFKSFFEPLKILGNANKISLGVMGIKEATAIQIEKNLKDYSSPYYLGPEFENMLEANLTGEERYDRLTDEKHYFSYLYGALYLKEMMEQWKDAGYDIKYRPEIVGTLFNVGFPQSKPKANPQVGGSLIEISGAKYSFGRLAYEFYYSGELMEEFPFQ